MGECGLRIHLMNSSACWSSGSAAKRRPEAHSPAASRHSRRKTGGRTGYAGAFRQFVVALHDVRRARGRLDGLAILRARERVIKIRRAPHRFGLVPETPYPDLSAGRTCSARECRACCTRRSASAGGGSSPQPRSVNTVMVYFGVSFGANTSISLSGTTVDHARANGATTVLRDVDVGVHLEEVAEGWRTARQR